MSLEGLILSLVLFVLVLAFIGAPLLSRRTLNTVQAAQRQRERVQVYYERVLHNLHDLDEDYATGKLDTNDYTAERALWTQRGIAALKQIDTLDSAHLLTDASADTATIDRDIEQRIEASIAAYKAKTQA